MAEALTAGELPADDQKHFAAGDQTVWIDASPFISQVCKDLDVGQLVNGENFSLFEAMSALEIMDPKMDAGMAGSGVITLEDAIDSGKAPVNINIPELVDVMDHLLACEASWHRGHSLAQTVFSCLYLLNLDRTSSNALLYSYCRTVRAVCSMIRTAISTVLSNEEEDLFTLAFGLPLEAEGDGKCLSALHAVDEVVTRKLKGSKGLMAKKQPAEEMEPLQDDPTLEEGYCQAVLCRLRFRKAFYHVVANMNKAQGRGLEMARKHIAVALLELKSVQKSTEFLSRCEVERVSQIEKTTASGRQAVGFDPKVNRRVSAPTPPRSISLLSWEETLNYFIKLLEDLETITSFSTNLSLDELFQTLVDFQKREPDLVPRAFLQLLLTQDGKLFGRDNMCHVLHRTFSLPESVNNEVFHSDNFVSKSGQLTLYLVRVLCTNMSWQHRKLGKLLSEWGVLLQQGDTLFDSLMHKTLGSLEDKELWESVIMGWTAEQTCWISTHLLMLGFQLHLYAPAEYCMIYWYLDHALLTELHYKQLKERKHPTSVELKERKHSTNVETQDAIGSHRRHHILCSLSWMIAALTADRKFSEKSQTIFNTEQERFIQRFDLFQKVPIPQPLSYVHYKKFTSQRNIPIKEQYFWSSQYFMTLQQHLQDLGHCLAKSTTISPFSRLQRTREINQLKHVASRNLIVLKIVDDAEPGDNLMVSFDFPQHPFFAVASVKKL
ncbi:hypothetical protein GOP47_0002951 [Adiantum capillus-veneris]|uniref:N-alpha-acetyltransferase 35, NatC auxiliary subunit n=1 Tax=Adiantum capillus-veneris TaxID=13818 RepID=A0A9D4VCS1_ADICA|nr:hypothetical protein GOP47_0002951 [Adiantum capillus-veneris]